MKTLQCKSCGDDVQVPENRASAICRDCGQAALVAKDTEEARIAVRRLVDSLEKEALLASKSAPEISSIRKLVETADLKSLLRARNQIEGVFLQQAIRQFFF
jgi:hypothetical protein